MLLKYLAVYDVRFCSFWLKIIFIKSSSFIAWPLKFQLLCKYELLMGWNYAQKKWNAVLIKAGLIVTTKSLIILEIILG